MSTQVAAPAFRRQNLRLERGLITPEEYQAYLLRAWVEIDDSLTDEQWRELGRFNGRVF